MNFLEDRLRSTYLTHFAYPCCRQRARRSVAAWVTLGR